MEEQRPNPTTAPPRPEQLTVEVHSVRAVDGTPLQVICLMPDAIDLGILMKGMGGPRPESVSDADEGEEGQNDRVREFLELGKKLIERYTALTLPNGELQTPAFRFGPAAQGDADGALSGRQLNFTDLSSLTETLMYLGGYLEGAAAASFSGDRGGSGAGDGTGPAIPNEPPALGSDPGAEPRTP
jgi:hypothetical protein